jgi:hypothetical protein
MNVTFYTHNIDPKIPEMQKKVFNALGLDILQVKSDDWKGHGGEIDSFLAETNEEIIIIWDVDCIPLYRHIVDKAELEAELGAIFSVAQKASHIPNSIIYASPAFLAFSRATWVKLGKPSFHATDRADCAGELTYLANDAKVDVQLLYPSAVERPKWALNDDIMFGLGTTYQDAIYHAFMSRKDNGDMFIKKCEEVLADISQIG